MKEKLKKYLDGHEKLCSQFSWYDYEALFEAIDDYFDKFHPNKNEDVRENPWVKESFSCYIDTPDDAS